MNDGLFFAAKGSELENFGVDGVGAGGGTLCRDPSFKSERS